MNRVAKFFKDFFLTKYDPEQAYLADAIDRIDLEQRIRRIDRGEAPFQQKNRFYF